MTKDNLYPENHPTYGMISIHKTHAHPGEYLVGSDLRHNSFISLKISTMKYKRMLSGDHYFDDNKLIEVQMSHSQWAEFLSSMNSTGVPCTLNFVTPEGQGYIRDEVPHVDKLKMHKEEFNQEFSGKIQEALEIVWQLSQGLSNKMGKKEQRELLHDLSCKLGNIKANQNFAIDQFNEAVESRMNFAKGELKSFLTTLGFNESARLPFHDETLQIGENNEREFEQN